MKILVVGAGALGTLFGVKLKKFGHEIVFLVKNPTLVSILKEKGFTVKGNAKETAYCHVFTANNLPTMRFDLVLFMVKAYDTESAIASLKNIETHYILSLQNGIGHQDILKSFFGEEKTLIGITGEGSLYISPGEVVHTGRGETTISFFKDRKGALYIADILKKAGFIVSVADDRESILWGKLIINAAINPLSALTSKRNGELLKTELLEIMKKVIEEGILVANSLRIKLPYSNPEEKLKEILEKTSSNKSSMLQDIERKRRTEIDYINGYIVRKARENNIEVPLNRALYTLVKAMERYLRFSQ